LLAEVLRTETVDRALVFTRTKHGADKVVRSLAAAGIAAQAIHGNKSQGQRERVLKDFRSGRVRTLIATDIAARGIDVDGISHVINYDLPNIPESYVHRIGRTARAGAEGIAISFCDGEEAAYLRDIEKLIRMTIPSTDRRSGRPHVAKGRATQPATANGRQRPSTNGGQPSGSNGGQPSGTNGGQPQKHSKSAKARNRSRQQRRERHEQHGQPVKADRPVVAGGGGDSRAGGGEIGSVRFMQGAPAREAQTPRGSDHRGPVRYAADSRSRY
jgi:ATP-dependent RNA helicase RhlE